ncbi:MAG: murein L,D-transpeptidase family protein [Bacteroidia bacterium]
MSSFTFLFGQDWNGPMKSAQKKHKRVKAAYDNKYQNLKTQVVKSGHVMTEYEIYLRVFKQEDEVEVWLKDKQDVIYTHLKTYSVCAKSGDLGPKRKEGDGQVPEGFYYISSFNAFSSYHLSMKVSYPNKSDLMKANGKPGGDIMVHGECVTIGCIPLENDQIEELYILCMEAFDRRTKVHIDIFPCKMTDENMKKLEKNYDKEIIAFWKTLKPAYDYFQDNKFVPDMKIDKNGDYYLVK